jgi:predicted XRE-type DNA-binding protein
MKEIWKDIEGFEGEYQISNLARVKSFKGKRAIILKQSTQSRGYKQVSLPSKCTLVHVLVARAFINKPEYKVEVNHINGDKSCNEVSNLEWVTHKENMEHALNTGLLPTLKGENTSNHKLTRKEVIDIKALLKEGILNQIEISERYNVSRPTISKINVGRAWSHI